MDSVRTSLPEVGKIPRRKYGMGGLLLRFFLAQNALKPWRDKVAEIYG